MQKILFSAIIAGVLVLNNSMYAEELDLDLTIATRFAQIWHTIPQEKVYLHTDKPYYYSAGDDIWFNAYIVNAATHIPDTKSQFVYVELLDQADSVLIRVKIKRYLFCADGKLHIPPEMPPGEYLLRAYTYWMQNVSVDFFFHKKIFIGNMIDDRIQMSYKFDSPVNGKIPATITFVNTFSTPLTEKTINITQEDIRKKRKKTSRYTTNQQGEIYCLLENDSTDTNTKFIEVSLHEPGITFNRKIQIPDTKKDFDVQFFPESGVFLDNQLQTVGFKAIGTNGLSINITGKIYNQREEELGEFFSTNNGMGKFILKTFPGEKYYALIADESGYVKKFALPETSSEGISLNLKLTKEKVFYRVTKQGVPETNNFFLMIHSRGVVYFITPIKNKEGFLPEYALPAGICSFSIIDSLENIWCERLVFIRHNDFPSIQMKSDKNEYGKRESVSLTLKLISENGQACNGNFSVSVTDSHLIKQDSINNNIISYLLLSSDLKGFIEEPQQYFYDNSLLTKEKTDLLMLTQGWRRFNTQDVVRGKNPDINYFLEAGQTVSGKVMNLFNKPVKDRDVFFFSPHQEQFFSVKTDSTGYFLIEGIDIPDSTSILLKAKSNTRIVDVELIPDKDVFSSDFANIPFSPEELITTYDDFLILSKEKYYNDGGMLMVNLDEITVKASAQTSASRSFYSGIAETTLDLKRLESYGNMSVMNIIGTLPGVMVFGNSVSVRGASGNPLFLIDGFETDNIDDIAYLDIFDIEEIALFKGPSTAIFGSRGGNGVIAITLKKSLSSKRIPSPSMAVLTPLGYQKPVEFYVPKYEVDSILYQTKPDLRTTIYWAPKLQTDEEGCIHLQFYTADKPNDYRVELEGITEEGKICRYEGMIRRKD